MPTPKDKAHDRRRVAGPSEHVNVTGTHSDYEFDVTPGSSKKDIGAHIARNIVHGFEDKPKKVTFNK